MVDMGLMVMGIIMIATLTLMLFSLMMYQIRDRMVPPTLQEEGSELLSYQPMGQGAREVMEEMEAQDQGAWEGQVDMEGQGVQQGELVMVVVDHLIMDLEIII